VIVTVISGHVVELHEHRVAYCARCRQGYLPAQLERDCYCPSCQADLSATIRHHVERCGVCRLF